MCLGRDDDDTSVGEMIEDVATLVVICTQGAFEGIEAMAGFVTLEIGLLPNTEGLCKVDDAGCCDLACEIIFGFSGPNAVRALVVGGGRPDATLTIVCALEEATVFEAALAAEPQVEGACNGFVIEFEPIARLCESSKATPEVAVVGGIEVETTAVLVFVIACSVC